MGGSQKRCTKGGDRVRGCITHLLSMKKINIGDFHVSVAINIILKKINVFVKFDLYIIDV